MSCYDRTHSEPFTQGSQNVKKYVRFLGTVRIYSRSEHRRGVTILLKGTR